MNNKPPRDCKDQVIEELNARLFELEQRVTLNERFERQLHAWFSELERCFEQGPH